MTETHPSLFPFGFPSPFPGGLGGGAAARAGLALAAGARRGLARLGVEVAVRLLRAARVERALHTHAGSLADTVHYFFFFLFI